ncbi:glycosyltransferase family 2 protein, partial [Staphylococcus kloosii]
MKLISIIVSVYNKEKFLEKCIQSIIDLKIDKSIIEAIFVDDVSTDNSYKIIKEYAEEYDFIRCIKLSENTGGPAEPRNVGIQEANGEYLTILDADDWLESDGIPKLVYQMRDNDSDIGFGQCYKHRNNEIVKVANFTSYKEDNGLVPYEINKIFRSIGPWAKIFKRSTVFDHNIKFKNLKYAEDKLFYCEIISKSKSASMTSENVYHVNRYTNNISLVKKTNVMEKAEYNL